MLAASLMDSEVAVCTLAALPRIFSFHTLHPSCDGDPPHTLPHSPTRLRLLSTIPFFHLATPLAKPRPQVTCKENLVRLGRVFFEIWERTDRQTDTLIAILCTPTAGRSNNQSDTTRVQDCIRLL